MADLGTKLDRLTIVLLKLEHALSKNERDERVGKWLIELRETTGVVVGTINPDEVARIYRLNRKIWDAEDLLLKESLRMSVEPEKLIEIGRLALEVRKWNMERSQIIATYNKFQDKV